MGPDPLIQEAQDTIRGLQGLVAARPADEQLALADLPLRKSVQAALAEIGLVKNDAARFVDLTLAKTPGAVLSKAQAGVLLLWAVQDHARCQAQAVMAVHSGRSGLVEL